MKRIWRVEETNITNTGPAPNEQLLSPGYQREPSETSEKKRLSATSADRGWPSGPRTITRKPSTAAAEIFLDVFLLALSLLFFIFGILVKQYDHAAVATHEGLASSLKDATTYGPTIFPILFAAVLGRASRYCLSWRLERGESLGVLDVLASSTTVTSVLLSQLALRSLSVLGCFLATLWLLSPLGSQAALRVMTFDSLQSTSPITVHYMSPNSSYSQWQTADIGSLLSATTGIYEAAMLSPAQTKHSPRDVWNNVKIPMIESFSSDIGSDWVDVPADGVTYSGLIGLPLFGLSTDASTSFTIETSYWHLNCPVLTHGEPFPGFNNISRPGGFSSGQSIDTIDSHGWHGATAASSALVSNSSNAAFGSPCNRNPNTKDLEPRTFVYDGFPASTVSSLKTESYAGSYCEITTTYVDVEVHCSGANCAASRVRKSPSPPASQAWTFLDDIQCTNWVFFSGWFVQSIDAKSSSTGTAVQGYLQYPDAPTTGQAYVSVSTTSTKHLWDVDKRAFADRLGQLLNSFWLASVGPAAILNGLSASNSNTTAASTESGPGIVLSQAAQGQVLGETNAINCHDGWLAALLITSGVLIIASLIPPFLRFWLHGSELSLNVSNMTRDNPNVAAPAGGTTLDSSDRSRLLKGLEVRYGDLGPDRDVGHLGIGSINEDNAVEYIRKDRLYE